MIDTVILLGSAVFIAVLGNDTALLLGKDMPVQRQIPHVMRNKKLNALGRVASRWRVPRPGVKPYLGARATTDVLSTAVVAGLTFIAVPAVLDISGGSVDWRPTLLAAPVLGLFATLLAAYTFVSTAHSFVTRQFDNAIASSLIGALTYALSAVVIVETASQTDGATWIVVALGVAFLVPPVLILTQLRARQSLTAPGWTIREIMYRSIVRDMVAVRAQRDGAHHVPKRRRVASVRDWSDRVTGMSVDPATNRADTADTADEAAAEAPSPLTEAAESTSAQGVAAA